jgi:YidC/Oxa1 family membrane protein insertase
MELQQREGYSPFAGCLPLLLQLPVLLGIYQAVRKPFTYMLGISNTVLEKLCTLAGVTADNQLGLFDKLPEFLNENTTLSGLTDGALTELPSMNAFGGAVNLAATPNIAVFNWLLLIPVLSFVFAYLSMKVSRIFNAPVQTAQSTPETEMSSKLMEMTMPLMSVFIAFGVPAAVGVYWMFNSVFSIIQTIILAKLMPLPTFTEEELRQYEKEMKASRSRASQGPRRAVRSRHHIDDDDYESLPEVRSQKSSKTPKSSGGIAPAPEKSDKSDDN